MLLSSERILTPAGVIAGELSLRDGVIERVTARGGGGLDLGARWVLPGFIDTHVHGGGGAQLHSCDADEIAAACRFHAAHGTTALLATTVSAPVDELEAVAAALAAASARRPTGAAIAGVHLEGPFVSRARPGAMDGETFLAPDPVVLGRLLAAAVGRVAMVTLAPELPGALALIARLAADGVVASLGHTDADAEAIVAAIEAGARSATHLYNAMAPLHHRAPGAVGAVLDAERLNAELIADGEHVSPSALRLAVRAKGTAGVRLVTDAIAAAGMPDGPSCLGDRAIEVREGRATLAGGATLAGSTLTMDGALRRAVVDLGLEVPAAAALASANPARVLGLESRKGALAPGFDADLVVLDERLDVWGTVVGGRWVHGPPS